MIRDNIIANIVGRGWSVIAAYIFVPANLALLGPSAFGLVAFYTTLLGLFAFADLGLSATVNREFARLRVTKEGPRTMHDLLCTYECLYLAICVILFSVIWVLAPIFESRWLSFTGSSASDNIFALRLMGASLAFQLPANLHLAGMAGLQHQVLSNGVQICAGTLRGAGGVLVLWLVSPTIEAFFLWQTVVGVVVWISARAILRPRIGSGAGSGAFSVGLIRAHAGYSLGMAAMSVLSAILLQGDKLIVSGSVSLEVFGFYSLAGMLAGVSKTVTSSIGAAIFPEFNGLSASGLEQKLTDFYIAALSIAASVAISIAGALAAFAPAAIYAWTGNAEAAQTVSTAARLLVIAETIQAVQVVPYLLVLSAGSVGLNIKFAAVSVVISVPLLIALTKCYGIEGAALSWLIVNVASLPLYLYLLHRKVLPSICLTRAMMLFARPTLVTASVAIVLLYTMPHAGSRGLAAVQVFAALVATCAATIATSKDLRNLVKVFARSRLV